MAKRGGMIPRPILNRLLVCCGVLVLFIGTGSLLQARCALGSVLVDPAEAEAEFRKALGLKPDLVCSLDGLAQVLLNEGRYDAALEYWRQAVRIEPDDVDLRLALATGTYKSAKA